MKRDEFSEIYVDSVIRGIEDYVKDSQKASICPNILLFIHGGLNGYEEGIKHVERILEAQKDTTHHPNLSSYYLVSINWEAGLRSSLMDYFFGVRQGERNRAVAIATSPFVFAGAIGQSVINTPRDMYYAYIRDMVLDQGPRLGTGLYYGGTAALLYASIIAGASSLTFPEIIVPALIVGGAVYAAPVMRHDPTYYLFGPIRMVSAPFIDGFGAPAWEMLKRRPDFVLFNPQLFLEQGEMGAGHTLLNRISEKMKKGQWVTVEGKKIPVKMTLMGHSMGSMVADRILRTFNDNLRFDDIIYMGAATSIADFQLTIPPYLRRHPESRFWSFSLSADDERNERYFYDLLMRGSLLVWIDLLFEPQPSLIHRRFGRAESQDYVIIDDIINADDQVWSRICRITYSGDKTKSEPKEHGDFTEPKKLEKTLSIVRKGCPKPTSIHQASKDELLNMPKLPTDLIETIGKQGPYEDKEELLDRDILSDSTYSDIKDFITPININSASIEQLARLLRGDRYLANKICERRETKWREEQMYLSIDDLKAIDDSKRLIPDFVYQTIENSIVAQDRYEYGEKGSTPPGCRAEGPPFWLFDIGKDSPSRTASIISSEWKRYRDAVLSEVQQFSEIRVISEEKGTKDNSHSIYKILGLSNQSSGESWDAVLEISGLRVSLVVHTSGQLREHGSYSGLSTSVDERIKYAEEIAARAEAANVSMVFWIWNKDIFRRTGINELPELVEQNLGRSRFVSLHGSPQEVVKAIVTKVQGRAQ